jgi:DNA-binding MarR family transcriptional regulator
LDVKILTRRGVSEVLAALSKKKPVTASELAEKTSISKITLPILREEGLVEVRVERVPIREVPVKRRHAFYRLTEKGGKMLELYETLSKAGSEDLLNLTPKQSECVKSLKEGRKRIGELPEAVRGGLQVLIQRGLVEKEVSEEEEKRQIYGAKRLYAITEKGLKAYQAYKTIESL